MSFLYDYMNEEELAYAKENALHELELVRLENMLESVAADHKLREENIILKAILENSTHDEINEMLEEEYTLYSEAVGGILGSIIEAIKSIIKAIFGIKDKIPETNSTKEIELPVDLKAANAFLDKSATKLKNRQILSFTDDDGKLNIGKITLTAIVGIGTIVGIAEGITAIKKKTKIKENEVKEQADGIAASVQTIGTELEKINNDSSINDDNKKELGRFAGMLSNFGKWCMDVAHGKTKKEDRSDDKGDPKDGNGGTDGKTDGKTDGTPDGNNNDKSDDKGDPKDGNGGTDGKTDGKANGKTDTNGQTDGKSDGKNNKSDDKGDTPQDNKNGNSNNASDNTSQTSDNNAKDKSDDNSQKPKDEPKNNNTSNNNSDDDEYYDDEDENKTPKTPSRTADDIIDFDNNSMKDVNSAEKLYKKLLGSRWDADKPKEDKTEKDYEAVMTTLKNTIASSDKRVTTIRKKYATGCLKLVEDSYKKYFKDNPRNARAKTFFDDTFKIKRSVDSHKRNTYKSELSEDEFVKKMDKLRDIIDKETDDDKKSDYEASLSRAEKLYNKQYKNKNTDAADDDKPIPRNAPTNINNIDSFVASGNTSKKSVKNAVNNILKVDNSGKSDLSRSEIEAQIKVIEGKAKTIDKRIKSLEDKKASGATLSSDEHAKLNKLNKEKKSYSSLLNGINKAYSKQYGDDKSFNIESTIKKELRLSDEGKIGISEKDAAALLNNAKYKLNTFKDNKADDNVIDHYTKYVNELEKTIKSSQNNKRAVETDLSNKIKINFNDDEIDDIYKNLRDMAKSTGIVHGKQKTINVDNMDTILDSKAFKDFSGSNKDVADNIKKFVESLKKHQPNYVFESSEDVTEFDDTLYMEHGFNDLDDIDDILDYFESDMSSNDQSLLDLANLL